MAHSVRSHTNTPGVPVVPAVAVAHHRPRQGTPRVAVTAGQGGQVRFEVGALQSGDGDRLIEVLHQIALGDWGQGLQRSV
ncbi:hypothetical protein KFL01_29350 [Kocuria flava]|uniref:Transposase n=1 Tax=Kocuria flava TaxID=446860 RepID=A0ABQ0XCL8_9MICC|nr:hypothetical protein KFL01_29350 [Kocuria flava]